MRRHVCKVRVPRHPCLSGKLLPSSHVAIMFIRQFLLSLASLTPVYAVFECIIPVIMTLSLLIKQYSCQLVKRKQAVSLLPRSHIA